MGNLENLVFQSTAEGEYYTYLIQYGLTKEELEALDVGEGDYEDDGTIWIPIDVDVAQFDDVLTGKLVYYCFTVLSLVTNTAHNGELHGTSADGSCATYEWCLGTKTWKAKSRCAYYDDGQYPNDPTPGGGGSGGGGDGEPSEDDPWEDPDIDVHNGPLLTSPNSGNGSGSVQTDDECDKIRERHENEAYSDLIDDLENNTDLHYETGFAQNADGSLIGLPPNMQAGTPGNHKLPFSSLPCKKGLTHVHIDDYETLINDQGDNDPINDVYKFTDVNQMFSFGDLYSLFTLIERTKDGNCPNVNVGDLYVEMIFSGNKQYVLTFTGKPFHINLANYNTSQLNIELRDKYYKKYSNTEKAFLRFVKDKIGIDGIRLFQIQDDGDVKEKYLDENGNVKSVDC